VKQKKQSCDLKSCIFCRQSLKEWLPAIDANRKNLHFKKGEQIFREGELMTGMFFVYSGLIKVHTRWSDDKELILRIAASGDIVGHRGLGTDNIYPASATALQPTDICYVDLDFFTASLKVNPGFLYQLMMFFASELKESEKRMRNLAHMPVKGRIANMLIFLKKKFGVTAEGYLNTALSRQDMAAYVGTTYESFFRIMKELEEEQVIRVDSKNITIIAEEILAALAE
jgi:CRP-like cAMP-binding protein